MSDLAWTGRVTMDTADWNDERGSTVTFRLPMGQQENARNPFHNFTKRRKGRAGTRFMMACQTAVEGHRQAIYEDEVMLAGWNDSQQKGHTAKFWLCSDALGHPFEGISRDETLLVSLVELDDDQQPINQKMRERVEEQAVHPQSRMSYVAAMLCKEHNFLAWIMNQKVDEDFEVTIRDHEGDEEDLCKQYIYWRLGIGSRAELDTNEEFKLRFDYAIRRPYLEWVGEDRGVL